MENSANNDLEFSKQIAHNITAIKQLSLRCLSNCSEMERSFYTQQIKDIFLQILQPTLQFQQQNFAELSSSENSKKNSSKNSNKNSNNNNNNKNFTEQMAKILLDANFALKVILEETVINYQNENYLENKKLILGQLESCIQSIDFVDIDKQQCQLVPVALPILSWSSYSLPKGNISNSQCKKIGKVLREVVASKENKTIILTNYLFDKNEIPDTYLSAAQLTQSLLNSYLLMRENSAEKSKKLSKENSIFVAEICRTEEIEFIDLDNDKDDKDDEVDEVDEEGYIINYDEKAVYIEVDGEECGEVNNRGDISEIKYLLAAFVVPKNKPVFSWMNVDKKTGLFLMRDDVYDKWYKKIMPTMKDIFMGCNFQTLLPETLFKAMQISMKISRRYGLEALLKYLRSIIGIIPTQLSVIIGGFYYFESNNNDADNSDSNSDFDNENDTEREILKEFRLSFKVRGTNQILCGYTWDLLDNFSDYYNVNNNFSYDIKEEESLSEIMEILKENNILDIHFVDNHFEYCLCQNCQQRLYINDNNEVTHPKLPDYLVFNKPN